LTPCCRNLRVVSGRPKDTFALFDPTSEKVVGTYWKFDTLL
jgi:hypothetical protein